MIDRKAASKTTSVTLPNVRFALTADLKPSPRNTRTHSKKQIRQIENSILRFDWTSPVLIDERSNIVAGHGRYLAAISLGLKQVPVISVSGLSEAELRALALADNKIAANAGWDRPMLAAEIADLAALLPDCGLDLSITGFDAAEIDPLMGDLLDPEQSPADSFEELDGSNPITRNGDIWHLGKHRLMCGDACDQAGIRSLAGDLNAAVRAAASALGANSFGTKVDPLRFGIWCRANKGRIVDGLSLANQPSSRGGAATWWVEGAK